MGHYSLWLAALRLLSAFAVGTIFNIGRKREMYSKEKKNALEVMRHHHQCMLHQRIGLTTG